MLLLYNARQSPLPSLLWRYLARTFHTTISYHVPPFSDCHDQDLILIQASPTHARVLVIKDPYINPT